MSSTSIKGVGVYLFHKAKLLQYVLSVTSDARLQVKTTQNAQGCTM